MKPASLLCMVLAAALATGCKEKRAPVEGSPAGVKPGDAAAPPSPSERRVRSLKPALPRADVDAFLKSWLAAQNAGDFAAYAASYAEGFGGVRRSGKKTVHLDRAGWLRDRERMFKTKMTVSADKVQIAVGVDGATAWFLQDWASGTYRDVGPKRLALTRMGDGLFIAREEMLASTLVNAPASLPESSAQFALVWNGQLVVSAKPIDDGSGAPSLVEGTIPEHDPDCDQPIDYETDNNRYFACHDRDPKNWVENYVATRAVKGGTLRKAWFGNKVALYGASGLLCQATVGEHALHAEWRTQAANIGSEDDSKAALAEAVLAGGAPIQLAALNGGCSGAAFARDSALPSPPMWAIAKPSDKTAAAARAALELDPVVAGAPDWAVPPSVTFNELHSADRSQPLVTASFVGAESCQEDTFLFYVLRPPASGDAAADWETLIAHRGPKFSLAAIADFTGDGVPEIVVTRGVLIWDGSDFYNYLPLVEFTDDVMNACHCECE